MYRALTWLAQRDGADVSDGAALAALALEHPVSFGSDGSVEVDGEDVTAAIREAEIDRLVPTVARHPEVREVMRERQRALAVGGDSVIEGRDIGSVVVPDAELKVFLARRPGGARATTQRGAARHRRGRARRRPTCARRARRGQHAVRPTTPFSSTRRTLTIDEVVDRIVELVEARR